MNYRLTTVVLDQEWAVFSSADNNDSDSVVGGLSADPETLAEAASAATRFGAAADLFASWERMTREEALARLRPGAPFRWLDLPARLLASDSASGDWPRYARVRDRSVAREQEVWATYHLNGEWQAAGDLQEAVWQAASRIEQRKPQLFDYRQTTYGAPLREFLLNRAVELAAGGQADYSLLDREVEQVTRAQRRRNEVALLHAQWLTTPREDLRGYTPRFLALQHHEHIERDLWDRQQQWSCNLRQPHPVARESAAYIAGGHSLAEHVLYFQLVRELATLALRKARRWRGEWDSGDFSDALEQMCERQHQWFCTPTVDGEEPPGEAIDLQRQRIPLLADVDTMLMDDCPCCQMLKDDPTPTFTMFDASCIDHDFVFSADVHRDIWEMSWGDFMEEQKEFDRQAAQRQGDRESPSHGPSHRNAPPNLN